MDKKFIDELIEKCEAKGSGKEHSTLITMRRTDFRDIILDVAEAVQDAN